MASAAAAKISFVSLGCPKALVDSERILTRLRTEGRARPRRLLPLRAGARRGRQRSGTGRAGPGQGGALASPDAAPAGDLGQALEKVGTRQQILIDEVGPNLAKGRSHADAPEIDGSVFVASRRPLRVGEIVTARIERAEAYDLHGTVVGF